jgi:hypothetical protein
MHNFYKRSSESEPFQFNSIQAIRLLKISVDYIILDITRDLHKQQHTVLDRRY